MVTNLKKCPKCGGNPIIDGGTPWCPNCGESPFNQAERKRWYKDHEKELCEFLAEHGTQRLTKAYPIPHQYISHLKASKYYKPKATPAPPAPASSNGRLPAFPSFDKDWSAEVQIVWLQTYRELSTKKS